MHVLKILYLLLFPSTPTRLLPGRDILSPPSPFFSIFFFLFFFSFSQDYLTTSVYPCRIIVITVNAFDAICKAFVEFCNRVVVESEQDTIHIGSRVLYCQYQKIHTYHISHDGNR